MLLWCKIHVSACVFLLSLSPDDTGRDAAGLRGVVLAGWLHPSRGSQKAPDDWSWFLYSYTNGGCGLTLDCSVIWYRGNASQLHDLYLGTTNSLFPYFFLPSQGYGLFLFTAKEHAWSIESHSLIAVPVVSAFRPHQIMHTRGYHVHVSSAQAMLYICTYMYCIHVALPCLYDWLQTHM